MARPPEEGLLGAMREVVRCELDTQLEDPRVQREFQVMLSTPSLRHLAREHFYEEEAQMVGAIAARLGVPRGLWSPTWSPAWSPPHCGQR